MKQMNHFDKIRELTKNISTELVDFIAPTKSVFKHKFVIL